MSDSEVPKWLADAFESLPEDPRRSVDSLSGYRAQGDERAVAASAFVVVQHLGTSEARDAEIVIDAARLGFTFTFHHLSSIASQHESLAPRVADLVESRNLHLDVDFSPVVRRLIDTGNKSEAAKLFVELAETSRQSSEKLHSYESQLARQTEAVEDWLARRSSQQDSTDAQIAELQEQVSRAMTNVGSISENVARTSADRIASVYNQQASTDARRAELYLVVAVAFLLIAVSISGVFTFRAVQDSSEINLGESLAHVTLSLALFSLSGYAARLAREYRQGMWHWRHTELQLRMFFPFLDRLSSDDRETIVAAVSPRFFPGQPSHPIRTGSDAATTGEGASLNDALLLSIIERTMARDKPTT